MNKKRGLFSRKLFLQYICYGVIGTALLSLAHYRHSPLIQLIDGCLLAGLILFLFGAFRLTARLHCWDRAFYLFFRQGQSPEEFSQNFSYQRPFAELLAAGSCFLVLAFGLMFTL